MANPTFGRSEVEFSDTPPLGWMAARPGLCWCEECSRKHAKGFGSTKEEAVAELLEQELEVNPELTNGGEAEPVD